MAYSLKHAENSANKFGGKPEDYLPIHNWLDESKAFMANFWHRALATLPSSTSRKVWAESRPARIGWRKSDRNAGCTVRRGLHSDDDQSRI